MHILYSSNETKITSKIEPTKNNGQRFSIKALFIAAGLVATAGMSPSTLSVTSALAEVSKAAKKEALHLKAEKRVFVRGAKQFRKLLAARGSNAQAVVISCSPINSNWCSGGFIDGCNRNHGGASTHPDGRVECSLPDVD